MRTTFPKLLALFLMSALMLLAIPALAGDEAEDASLHATRGRFLLLHRADADRNGIVTADEWREMTEAIGAAWTALDEDADGTVTLAQRMGRHAARMPRHLRRMGRGPAGQGFPGDLIRQRFGYGLHRAADAAGDGDGTLSRDEWIDFLGDTDADSDGVLSRDELRSAIRALRPEREQPTGPSVDDLIAGFDTADTDQNGLLTESERPRARRGRWQPPQD